jgi:long-chain acyl-CoA synthetase
MGFQPLPETSVAAVDLNRTAQFLGKDHLISKYKFGRHHDTWQNHTWDELEAEKLALISAWGKLGLNPGDKVAILGANRPRWITTAISAIAAALPIVPVYPTLTAEESAYVLRDSGAKIVVVDTMKNAKKVMENFHELPELSKIFVMDAIESSPDENIASFDSLIESGKPGANLDAVRETVSRIAPDDLCTLIYTSGTTGDPKGVMLTHGNFLSQRVLVALYKLSEDDIFLNHLPLCHSFGLTADLFGSSDVGAVMAIAEGMAPEQIRAALTEIRPTVLNSVPRLYEKLYVQVHQIVSSRPEKVQALFKGALAIGKQVFDLKNSGQPVPFGLLVKYKLARRILDKVRKRAGLDRLRIAYAGGGPSSRELCYFFQSLGLDLYQGYGLTETSPVSNVNVPGKNKMGTVGPTIKDVEMKIAEDGEILLRGPNIMKGYYNNPEATKEAIDADGWFFTGDIGTIDSDGYLTITDRKKELIVTSAGKNIAPLSLECAFNTDPFIERAVIIGDNRKFLTALVCPNVGPLTDWAKKQGLSWKDDAELVALPEVVELIEKRVAETNGQFARFEQIKKIAIMDHEFTEETGELTATQKVKRREVNRMYKEQIEALYPKDTPAFD